MCVANGTPRSAYVLLLPEMRHALDLTYTQTGLIAAGNFVSYVVLTLLGGVAVARFGSPLLLCVTVPLVGLGMVAMGTAGSLGVALAAFSAMGVGAAVATIAATTLPARWIAPTSRGRVVGIIVGGMPFGQLAAGLVLPALARPGQSDWWRLGWFVLGGFTLLVAALSALGLRTLPPAPPGQASASRWAGARQLLDRWPVLFWLILEGIFEGLSYVTFNVFFAAYLSGERQVPLAITGQLWMLNGVLAMIGVSVSGSVSDRFDRRLTLAGILLAKGLSYALLATVGDMAGFTAAIILNGIVGTGGLTIVTVLCVDLFGSRLGPAAVGIANCGFATGQAIAPLVNGYTADVTGSFTLPLYLSAAFAAAAALCVVLVPRPPKPSPEVARSP